ncbi:TPA: ParB-like nuclease domain-containing protein [Salmonella enterica]|nr:ParB-like nuclease domain-containing protein [Salmonella enterica]
MKQEKLKKYIEFYLSKIVSDDEKIQAINQLKEYLHERSPLCQEPVDCVIWVKSCSVIANDYNPNVMTTTEKRLLKHSLQEDGFTQPIIVSERQGQYLIVDGFHRYLLGKSPSGMGKRLQGYVPVVCVNPERKGKSERIAATIRHNRARGKHQITAMSDVVRDLSRMGWGDERIARELGMDADEVLRLKQISGLVELFQDEEFSQAWTIK